jgi:hypothetical protein
MEAGLVGSDEYLAEWRRETRECGPDLERAVNDEVARLEALLPPDELARLVGSQGRAGMSDSDRP